MNNKFIGGMLIVVGTSIGGGMLALPVANAQTGFIDSSLFLIGCWALMTLGALVILEVNLWLPAGTNLVSMAGKTLGKYGQAITWFCYLLLLYTLLCAYIAGGGSVFQSLFSLLGVSLSPGLSASLFVVILGAIVIRGIHSVDLVNRGLMSGKFLSYFLLLLFISPHIQFPHLLGGHAHYITGTLMILLTSFGFASVVPSLRTYFKSDVKQLRRAIIFGSLIPLTCYLIWDAVILGVIPVLGPHGLLTILTHGDATSGLTNALQSETHSGAITDFSRAFISICMFTSFLGVALSLKDFLADGLKLSNSTRDQRRLFALTFVPPLCVILFYPHAFISAIAYAGILCIILLVLLPGLMAWRGRGVVCEQACFEVAGGKIVLAAIILAGFALSLFGIIQALH